MRKMAFEGEASPKNKGKMGGHVKLSKNWHNVLGIDVLELQRKKRAEENAKKSREAKDKSYEDYSWTELCENVTKLKRLLV